MQNIRNDLERIFIIYINAKETFHYCNYLHNPDTHLELEYLSKDRHLKVIRHMLWRQSIVEISKLTSRSSKDEFRILHFIDKLRKEKEVQERINSSVFSGWIKSWHEHKNAIKNINNLRNKIYAHTDREIEEYRKVELYFEDVQRLFDCIGEIIKDVYQQVFNGDVDLRTPVFERGSFDLVRCLAESHNERVQMMLASVKKGA
jgi:hypothetical protein